MSQTRYPTGTLNLVAIQDTIYNWVNSSMQGILEPDQIIWRNQSEPLPPRPCVTLKFTYGPSPVARDGNVISGGVGCDTIGMQQEATLSVQVFGNTKMHKPMADQIAIDLNSSLLRREVRRVLNIGGVSIHSVGKPQNMTALEESRYEERAGFELSLGMVQNVTDAPGKIEHLNINRTVGGESLPAQTINLPVGGESE